MTELHTNGNFLARKESTKSQFSFSLLKVEPPMLHRNNSEFNEEISHYNNKTILHRRPFDSKSALNLNDLLKAASMDLNNVQSEFKIKNNYETEEKVVSSSNTNHVIEIPCGSRTVNCNSNVSNDEDLESVSDIEEFVPFSISLKKTEKDENLKSESDSKGENKSIQNMAQEFDDKVLIKENALSDLKKQGRPVSSICETASLLSKSFDIPLPQSVSPCNQCKNSNNFFDRRPLLRSNSANIALGNSKSETFKQRPMSAAIDRKYVVPKVVNFQTDYILEGHSLSLSRQSLETFKFIKTLEKQQKSLVCSKDGDILKDLKESQLKDKKVNHLGKILAILENAETGGYHNSDLTHKSDSEEINSYPKNNYVSLGNYRLNNKHDAKTKKNLSPLGKSLSPQTRKENCYAETSVFSALQVKSAFSDDKDLSSRNKNKHGEKSEPEIIRPTRQVIISAKVKRRRENIIKELNRDVAQQNTVKKRNIRSAPNIRSRKWCKESDTLFINIQDETPAIKDGHRKRPSTANAIRTEINNQKKISQPKSENFRSKGNNYNPPEAPDNGFKTTNNKDFKSKKETFKASKQNQKNDVSNIHAKTMKSPFNVKELIPPKCLLKRDHVISKTQPVISSSYFQTSPYSDPSIGSKIECGKPGRRLVSRKPFIKQKVPDTMVSRTKSCTVGTFESGSQS